MALLAGCRGRRRTENFNEEHRQKLREINGKTKHLFTTGNFQVMFSLLMRNSLPRIFCKTR